MVIGLALSSWISGYTSTQNKKEAIFKEDGQCREGYLENNIDLTQYDASTGLLKTQIKNTGSSDLSLGKYQVWSKGSSVPTTWVIDNPTNAESSIKRQNAKNIILKTNKEGSSPSDIVRIKVIAYLCDGVTISISQPLGGWANAILSHSTNASEGFIAARPIP